MIGVRTAMRERGYEVGLVEPIFYFDTESRVGCVVCTEKRESAGIFQARLNGEELSLIDSIEEVTAGIFRITDSTGRLLAGNKRARLVVVAEDDRLEMQSELGDTEPEDVVNGEFMNNGPPKAPLLNGLEYCSSVGLPLTSKYLVHYQPPRGLELDGMLQSDSVLVLHDGERLAHGDSIVIGPELYTSSLHFIKRDACSIDLPMLDFMAFQRSNNASPMVVTWSTRELYVYSVLASDRADHGCEIRLVQSFELAGSESESSHIRLVNVQTGFPVWVNAVRPYEYYTLLEDS